MPPEDDRPFRLSRRALALGSIGVLLAAAIVAVLGFTAAGAHGEAVAAPTASASSPQLVTLSLGSLRGHKPLGRP